MRRQRIIRRRKAHLANPKSWLAKISEHKLPKGAPQQKTAPSRAPLKAKKKRAKR